MDGLGTNPFGALTFIVAPAILRHMRFAKWVFLLAGIIGVLVVIPPYVLEEELGRDNPPVKEWPV